MKFNLKYQLNEAMKYLMELRDSGIVEIKKVKPLRSIDQNKLMWLWLTCIAKETGNDVEDLHSYFKALFLPSNIVLNGNSYNIGGSTTKLTTAEFKAYLDKIQSFALNKLNIHLPNPEDINFEKFKNYYENYI